MEVYSVVSMHGSKELLFHGELPGGKNLEMALHSICYERDNFNVGHNAYLKIDIYTDDILHTSCTLHLPLNYYNTFEAFRKDMYRVAKKNKKIKKRRHILLLILRMVVKDGVLTFRPLNRWHYTKSTSAYRFRISADVSIKKLLGISSEMIEVGKDGLVSGGVLKPIMLDNVPQFTFLSKDLNYRPIDTDVLKYVPVIEGRRGVTVEKCKMLEYRPVNSGFKDRLYFDWDSNIKVYYFIIMLRSAI